MFNQGSYIYFLFFFILCFFGFLTASVTSSAGGKEAKRFSPTLTLIKSKFPLLLVKAEFQTSDDPLTVYWLRSEVNNLSFILSFCSLATSSNLSVKGANGLKSPLILPFACSATIEFLIDSLFVFSIELTICLIISRNFPNNCLPSKSNSEAKVSTVLNRRPIPIRIAF